MSNGIAGGAQSYKWVGYTFGGATANEIPFDADSDQWEKMLQEVQNYVESGNEEQIWFWYKQTYPEAMALIPAKRKESFLRNTGSIRCRAIVVHLREQGKLILSLFNLWRYFRRLQLTSKICRAAI